jgi:hypothetical protein
VSGAARKTHHATRARGKTNGDVIHLFRSRGNELHERSLYVVLVTTIRRQPACQARLRASFR